MSSSASSNPFSALGEVDRTTGKLPPATPLYILRGHGSPIHALHFYSMNSRLISGDSDGWVVVWNMSTKRAVASWKAHESAVLGVEGVVFRSNQDAEGKGSDSERWIFTHGRDHKLRVWRLNLADEDGLTKELPVDESKGAQSRSEPWMLHSLSVNALNFCAFALCRIFSAKMVTSDTQGFNTRDTQLPEGESSKQPHVFFLAVPNALNSGGIDIFHLPSEKRVSTISPDPSINTGMVMALELFRAPQGNLYLISGYEDGRVMVHRERSPGAVERVSFDQPLSWSWERIYINHAHSQPVLSIALSPLEKQKDRFFFSSSADAILAKHPVAITVAPSKPSISAKTDTPLKLLNTKHAGQQGLQTRNDGKVFATAGWDGRIRVYSCKSMRELAVLKWHNEGCYAVAFADIGDSNKNDENNNAAMERNTVVNTDDTGTAPESTRDTNTKPESMALNLAHPLGSLAAIKEQRSKKAQFTHWLAAGSKDGKISLWDIY
ncbi:WD repeat protein, variant [Blastomyces gilchristii SLH14081]|uniref:ASTRA-associated protein 1 n=1 Tax=Blastomyces gilchristii (strain SLH14081) TaxID=559298 RepID=A0A179UC22_BLAGS|nr:WD repeat protein, variant [Blastomyces gilchristii SLH14081]XP_031576240.1 WD repeat protein [Blastomyces gilchristii SLH14081]OAT04560.1 WD repeat protein [Blastomyces gilchristii SLH14081]OAT04561.1 WD repeat protein, variant [Blastomyces gilchristii SLH14081]